MALTTPNSAAGWRPDITAFAPADVIADALVLQTSTVSGRVEGDEPSVRVIHVEDADAAFVAEGADISLDDPALAETVVHTGKVAQLVKVSREQYSQNGTANLLGESVRRAVVRRANQAYLSQVAPTPPAVTPPAGLLAVSGITDGGTLGGDLDALVDAVASIEGADGEASHIIAAPDVWAELRKLKQATGSNAALLGAGTDDSERRLLGLPVLTTSAMTAGSLLVLDRSAVVSAVGDVQVATSEHTYFGSDSIAMRVTFRFGQNVVHADRVVKLALA